MCGQGVAQAHGRGRDATLCRGVVDDGAASHRMGLFKDVNIFFLVGDDDGVHGVSA
jgi:hypothetical protein